jgi:RimJ/RimL family protein N-acetyltransferase
MSIDFTEKPRLRGQLVELRPIRGDDAEALMGLMDDPEVTRLTGSAHSDEEARESDPWDLAELQEVYARWATAADRLAWVIVDARTGDVVGEAMLSNLDPGNRSCGFRIWIAGATNRGLGTEATDLVVRHAFMEQKLNRVELEVYAFNPRARHVYEKVGFVLEGTRRQALRYNGDWVDAHVMAVLASEWCKRAG